MRQVGKTKFHWVRRVLVFCWEYEFPVALHGALAKVSGCGRRWRHTEVGCATSFHIAPCLFGDRGRRRRRFRSLDNMFGHGWKNEGMKWCNRPPVCVTAQTLGPVNSALGEPRSTIFASAHGEFQPRSSRHFHFRP